VLDTVDPARVEPLLETLRAETTRLVGVSKSGATLETAANFLVFESWMRAAIGDDTRDRVAVVCGEGPNALRRRATERGYACFDVPDAVGGRYSALTPVGLLPAACLGVDPRRIVAGARAARERCLQPALEDNPALALAALHAAAHENGRSAAVLWTYADALEPLGPWWAQLVGESLGKRRVDGPVGATPLAAVGPAAQHSLLQLLVDGPDDKLTVFVTADVPDGPSVPADAPDLGAGGAQPLGAVLRAEREGTEYALAQAGRPSATISLGGYGPETAGAFLFTYQAAVVWWAHVLGVDPFGQPGVELGKQASRARLTGEPADLARALDEHRDRPRRTSR
jgi:glucose-6-phosphate isomerase